LRDEGIETFVEFTLGLSVLVDVRSSFMGFDEDEVGGTAADAAAAADAVDGGSVTMGTGGGVASTVLLLVEVVSVVAVVLLLLPAAFDSLAAFSCLNLSRSRDCERSWRRTGRSACIFRGSGSITIFTLFVLLVATPPVAASVLNVLPPPDAAVAPPPPPPPRERMAGDGGVISIDLVRSLFAGMSLDLLGSGPDSFDFNK
jgi:hypothetical protein